MKKYKLYIGCLSAALFITSCNVDLLNIPQEGVISEENFYKTDADCDEAITAVTYFIDDAILVGMSRVRILHGTGSGILRQLIRQYLATVPNVTSFRDEHVQFGGAGITVVDLE